MKSGSRDQRREQHKTESGVETDDCERDKIALHGERHDDQDGTVDGETDSLAESALPINENEANAHSGEDEVPTKEVERFDAKGEFSTTELGQCENVKSVKIDNECLAFSVTGTPQNLNSGEIIAMPGIERSIQIDYEQLANEGVLFPENHYEELRDQMRRIKRPILDNAFGPHNAAHQRGNIVMIASAMSGEGKTFTSINLALSIAAEKDIDVLLVDCDIAKPHASEIFGLDEYAGVIDYLAGDVESIDDVIVKTDLPGLSILSAGRNDDLASELLASKKMADLVREIAENHPNMIVLFDSSPVLQTNESHVLSRHVGQVVLVVAANITPTDAAKEAVSLLGRDQIINLVFNGMTSILGQNHYYGGYYGYQNGRKKQ